MKNIFKYFLFIVITFIGINGVSAASGGGHSFGEPEGGAICSYDIPISDSKWEGLMCEIDANGKADCDVYNSTDDKNVTIESYNDSTSGSTKKSYFVTDVIENNACPYIVYLETRNLFGSLEAYAYTSKSDAMIKESDRKKFYENTVILTTSNANVSYEDQVQEYVDYLSRFGVDSKLDDYCILEDGVYRVAFAGEQKAYSASLCRSQKSVELANIKAWNDIVTNLVVDGKISKDNAVVVKYFELSNKAIMTLGNTSMSHNEDEEQVKETNFEEVIAAKLREKDLEGQTVSGCQGLLGPNTLAFLKQAMNVIMIVGPIIAVVLGTYELITAMAAGDDDAKKKGIKKFQNRLIAVALLLLVPYIVKLILNIAGKGGSDCL